jgi:O-acetyl-ADP-ribose deacetylase (regulator of RNase III)
MDPKIHWNNCAIHLHRGDITALEVDAIVNAANSSLMGGGGVDGAIHRRGGPRILQECQEHIRTMGHRLPTGQAVLTSGGNLRARHVIHTAGPIYDAAGADAPRLLADCYRNSLALARQHGLTTIAFPCISAGAYGYPSDEACHVAIEAVRAELEANGGFQQVIFCTFGEEDHAEYERELKS